jgi:replicative superfamily II helicase
MKVKEAIFVPTNLYGKEINPLPWQIDAGNYDNFIIVAPTGAGKSLASYIWAETVLKIPHRDVPPSL